MGFSFRKDLHTALWGFEEWLVSARPDAPSRVNDASGRTLSDICPRFPLLIKRICADQRLSVQVHPNDVTAKTVGGEAKTEMWCVLKDGPLFAGFQPGVTADDVRRATADGTFEALLRRFDARRGECYFIPGGLVHAIGEGTWVYEVQQSSNTTFRLYDWGRVGANGKPRTLHVNEGLAAMDLTLPPPVPSRDVTCPYFTFTQTETPNGDDTWRVGYDPQTGVAELWRPGETITPHGTLFLTTVNGAGEVCGSPQNAPC